MPRRPSLLQALAVLPAALLLATGAWAQGGSATAASDRPEAVQVIVYRGGDMDGLAQITETRWVEIGAAGDQTVSFRGVADGLVPETVAVQGLPGRLKERNEDYDLISPGSVLAKSVGESVTLVRTNPADGRVTQARGVLRSAPSGMVIDFGDHVEALQCSGLPERLVFDRMPAGLSPTPTLSVQLRDAQPGRYRVTLSYLATGVEWEAHYVARLNPDGGTLDLTGWMSIRNEGTVGFEGAGTSVVAGELNMTGEDNPPQAVVVARERHCWPTGSTHGRAPPPPPPPAPPMPMASMDVSEVVVTGSRLERKDFTAISPITTVGRSLGDYLLYTMPQPTTVAARQTKQVLLLARSGVKYEAVYAYRIGDYGGVSELENDGATLMLRLDHRRNGTLDLPLPRGEVALIEPQAAGPLLAGAGAMGDSPVGPPIEIYMGQTQTVVATTRLIQDEAPKGGPHRRTVEVTLTNLRAAPVLFELRQSARDEGFKLLSSDRRAGSLHGDPMWRLVLQPGKPVTFRYRYETAE